jgi:hypothetical protein
LPIKHKALNSNPSTTPQKSIEKVLHKKENNQRLKKPPTKENICQPFI